ncbi:hypothetical protein UlMin_005836 [Ulmus minor]
MDNEPHSRKKFANPKSQRVKADESFAPTLEDETVQHLLEEPKTENGALYFGEENVGTSLGIGDFPFEYEYGFNAYRGGLNSNTARQGEDELELGVLDGLLDEVEEVEDIHAADGLANPCEDFLLDMVFAGRASGFDYGPYGGTHSRNVSSDSQSPGLSGTSNSPVGISDSSTVTIQELECKNDTLDKTETYEVPAVKVSRRKKRRQAPLQGSLHPDTLDKTETFEVPTVKVSRRNKRRQAPLQGSLHPASLNSQTLNELDDDEDPLISSMLYRKNGKSSGKACKVGEFVKEKRSRKRTQRYIEEFSDKKSKILAVNVAPADFKEKRQKVRFDDRQSMRPGMLASVPEEDSLCGTKSQAVSEFRARRGRPKKQVQLPKPEEELFSSESEDDLVIRKRSEKNDRRKHQRMWTMAEVTKLVDGISEYGVGRWTDIKRVLFTTSDYRTPIDLRDKWRNLLRASSGQKLKKKEVEPKQSGASRPMPMPLLLRVRELAKIHPYPRARRSK